MVDGLRQPKERRKAGLGVAVVGVVLLALFLAMPRIQGYEVHCDPESTSERVAGGGWWAVRGPQDRTPATYNATDGTTLIVPGCGHGDAGLALRVAGDHRGFDAEGDRLILQGHGVTGGMAPVNRTDQEGFGGSTPQPLFVLNGTFEVRSLWVPALVAGGGLAALACGLGLVRASSRRAPWGLPSAAAVGVLLAHWAWSLDAGLFLFFILFPVLGVVPAIVGIAGTAGSWKRRSFLAFAAILAYAVAFWFTVVAFGGAYPLSPDA